MLDEPYPLQKILGKGAGFKEQIFKNSAYINELHS